MEIYNQKKKGPLCLDFDPCSFDLCQENEICFSYGELGQYDCLSASYHNLNGTNINLIRKIFNFIGLFFVYLPILIYYIYNKFF